MTEQQDTYASEVKRLQYYYLVFAVTMVMMWIPVFLVTLTGSIALMVTTYRCYKYRKNIEIKGSFVDNHYHWLIRTFWIGTGLVMPLATMTALVIVIKNLDMSYMQNMVIYNELAEFRYDKVQEKFHAYFEENMRAFLTAIVPAIGFIVFWWYGRLIKGYRRMRKALHMTNVKSWLF